MKQKLLKLPKIPCWNEHGRQSQNAELGPDMSGEYSPKCKKFPSKQAEIVYKVTELNTRVMDDELNRYVTNVIGKLDDGKSVSKMKLMLLKLIQRGKSRCL